MRRIGVALSTIAILAAGLGSSAHAAPSSATGLALQQAARAETPPAIPMAKAASRRARVNVTITSPPNVPGTVRLVGRVTRVVAKPPKRSTATVSVRARAGRYAVKPVPVVIDGTLFAANARPKRITVGRTGSVAVSVRYRAVSAAARNLEVTALTARRVSLTWEAAAGTAVALRRTVGPLPARSVQDGKALRTAGRSAVDTGLKAGKQYSYALFTRLGRTWVGPVSTTVGTRAAPASGAATFVAPPTTVFLNSTDAEPRPTGSGIRYEHPVGSPLPALGSIVVLPRSASLPGGYLGRVVAISADGTFIDLRAAALSDAFDAYSVNIRDIESDPVRLRTARQQAPSNPASNPARPNRTPNAAPAPSAANALPGCLGGSASSQVTFSPSIDLGGHFVGTIDKIGIFGRQVPSGVGLDVQLTATVTGALAAKTDATVKCTHSFLPVLTPIATTPVPISFYFSPVAEVGLGGDLSVQNVGVAVTAGVWAKGHISLTDSPSFAGGPILEATPLKPVIKANGAIRLAVGGEVIVGPGAGTPKAGVIAGIGGRLNPLDASFGPHFQLDDSRFDRCLKAEVAFTRELNLNAKAWLGNWDLSRSVTIDAFKGSTPLFGSPWYLPRDCENATPSTVTAIFDEQVTASVDNPAPAGAVFTPGPRGRVGGSAEPVTFHLARSSVVVVTVTDAFLKGDVMEVLVDGRSIGTTSPVPIGGSNYSTGTFRKRLGAGSHSVDLVDITLSHIGSASPFGGGVVPTGFSPAGINLQILSIP